MILIRRERGNVVRRGYKDMFILISRVDDSIRLLQIILSKLDGIKCFDSKKHKDKKTSKGSSDEFVPDNIKNVQNSLKDLISVLIAMITGGFNGGDDFNKYLKNITKELKFALKGNLSEKLCNKDFVDYLKACLKKMTDFIKEKNPNEKAFAQTNAMSSLANILALDPITALGKLIKIANNTDFPPEVRAFAAALVNDALSHMKDQSIDAKTASKFVSMLSSSPDDIKGLVFSGYRDARKIEEAETPNQYALSHQDRGIPLYGFTKKGQIAAKNLALA